MPDTKEMLEKFTAYCQAHPEQRFFQALRNWMQAEIDADCNFIFIGSRGFWDGEIEEAVKGLRDTYYM